MARRPAPDPLNTERLWRFEWLGRTAVPRSDTPSSASNAFCRRTPSRMFKSRPTPCNAEVSCNPKAFATTTRVCDGYLTKNDQVLVATED